MIKRIFLIIFLLPVTIPAVAQSFKLMRFDEDYSYLKDTVRNAYGSFKYLPLSRKSSGSSYLSFGGEFRAEYDHVSNEDWGGAGLGTDPYFTSRLHLHADLHLGNRFRVFGQLRSALEDGRNNGPRPIDEDLLNVQNLFADVVAFRPAGGSSLTFRLGRQEVNYGTGRLISVQDGPNARLYFDGAKAMYAGSGLKIDAFVMAAAQVRPGVFDNSTSSTPGLWGAYSTRSFQGKRDFDIYYIGFRAPQLEYEEGIADETRHTFGFRLGHSDKGFNYNVEGALQSGSFGERSIRAWAGSIDLSWRFAGIRGEPLAGLKNDYISGDRSPDDGRLQTFNPIYPKAGYFGFNPQLGPVNLIAIHPYLTWNAGKKVMLTFDVVLNWRYSLNDGVYRPNGRFSTGSHGSSERYIGTVFLSGVEWSISKYLSFNSGVQYFKTGEFINDIIPDHKDGLFMSSQVYLRF